MGFVTFLVRPFVWFAIGIATGATMLWGSMVSLFAPTDHELRILIAGHYAQQMARFGTGPSGRFEDCEMDRPEPDEVIAGTVQIGRCVTSASGAQYRYDVALDRWGRVRHSDFLVTNN